MNAIRGPRRRLFTVIGFGIACVVSLASFAQAQIAGTESIESLFPLPGEIAGYDPSMKALRFFTRSGAQLKEVKKLSVEAHVMSVIPVTDGYLYATGVGRESLQAPIQVIKVTKDGGRRQVVFEYAGERNQVNGLVSNDGKVWIDFFESKYITKIGYLSPQSEMPWKFTEVGTVRMGDSMDVVGNTVVVGRSYGDDQGHDGDALLLADGERILLPTYRGVRGVKIISDNPKTPSIIIGDGWHQNYGQIAQARVSLLKKREGESRYALEILDRDRANTDFSKFFEFTARGRRYIAARGNATIVIYGPEGEWSKKTVYNQTDSSRIMDVAPLPMDSDAVSFAVLDNGIRLVQFAP